MKRKIFIPTAFWFYFITPFLVIAELIIVPTSIIGLFSDNRLIDKLYYIIAILGAVGLVFTLLKIVRHVIIVDDKYVSMPSEKGWIVEEPIQFKAKIRFDKIINIYLEYSTKNSKNLSMRDNRQHIALKRYLVVETEKRKYRLLTDNYTKKSLVKITDEIKRRMKIVGNLTEIRDSKEIVYSVEKPRLEFFVRKGEMKYLTKSELKEIKKERKEQKAKKKNKL